MFLHEVKILKCIVWGELAKVNDNYPIAQVTCQPCHKKRAK